MKGSQSKSQENEPYEHTRKAALTVSPALRPTCFTKMIEGIAVLNLMPRLWIALVLALSIVGLEIIALYQLLVSGIEIIRRHVDQSRCGVSVRLWQLGSCYIRNSASRDEVVYRNLGS
jgi:hypothetical protein